MSCLFSCFRVKEDDTTTRSHGSKPITAVHKESVDCQDRNCLWSVLVSEENSDYLVIEDGKCGVAGSPVSDGLRAEAKFLKACGTLPQTPAEIRKAEKLKVSQARDGDTESPIHSWFPNAALEKTLGKEPDQLQSPVSLFNKRDNGSEPSIISSSSFKTGKSTSSIFTSSSGGSVKHVEDAKSLNSSASHTPTVPTTEFKTKSVHFEDQSVAFSFSSRSSSPKTANECSNPSETPFSHNTSKPSPYPTPLKLTDDMQTPGTVFPSYVYDNESGTNKRIRYQYVYSGLNPEKLSQFKAPIEEEFGSDDCLEQTDKETPHSKVNLEDSSTEKESNGCPTLSSWLQSKPENEGCIDQSPVDISEGILDFGKTPGDRPILGTVAAHWNADETPKLWGGNGIPNTTTKYKEDQKVSWHATPFEQRLEKALLEDQCIPKKKELGETPPIDL
nr:protein JASON-like [Tanacetum cinerariifolium]